MHIFASWPYLGAWGVQIFANGPPTETRLEGEEEGDEEQEEEEEEEPNYFDSSGDEIPYVKRSREAAAARRGEEKNGRHI